MRDLRVRDLGADRASVEVDAGLLPARRGRRRAGRGRRPRGRVRGGRDRPARLPVRVDERGPVAVTLDAADVLARAAEWVWVPDDAREMPHAGVPGGRLPARHFAEPTEAFPHGSSSERPAAQVVDDVLAAAAVLGRDAVDDHGPQRARPGRRTSRRTSSTGARAPRDARGAGPRCAEACPTWTSRTTSRCARSWTSPPCASSTASTWRSSAGRPQQRGAAGRDGHRARGGPSTPRFVAYLDGEPAGCGRLHLGRRGAAALGRCLPPRGARPRRLPGAPGPPAPGRRDAGCRMALVKGRVETSAPILRRAGFAAYGEERAYRVTAA